MTEWTDLPPFNRTPNVQIAIVSDSIAIDQLANDIVADVIAAASTSQLFLVALAIKTERRVGEPASLHIIQLRTKDRIYIFKV